MKTKQHLRVWFLAVRPKTLFAAVAPVMIGTTMAYTVGQGHAGSAFAALAGALLIQIGTNFANDYFDYIKGADNEERMGPLRVTQAGYVAPKTMFRNFVLTFGLATLVGLYLVYRGGWPIVLVGLLSISSGILYTAGPWPLGYLGLGDLFVLIFFGPVAVCGTFYVQALEVNEVVFFAGLGPGLLATSLLVVNNLRDLPTDRKAGKMTLAVRFGPTFARAEYLVLFCSALILPVLLALWLNEKWYACISILILIPGSSAIRQIISGVSGRELNQTLNTSGKLIILYSILFSIGWWIG